MKIRLVLTFEKLFTKFLYLILLTICFLCFSFIAYAENPVEELQGRKYEFEKKSKYQLYENEEFTKTDKNNSYGKFSIKGNISDIKKHENIPFYEVEDGNLKIFYKYDDAILNASDDKLQLVKDKSDEVDNIKLDDKIGKGTILVQTSKNRKTWVTVKCETNMFENYPVYDEAFIETTDVQLLSGGYFRLIVVYQTRIKAEPEKFLFIEVDKYDYKKNAEVYEFYACRKGNETESNKNRYTLGKKVKCESENGYFGEAEIDEEDMHYGWDIGQFFVDGYTSTVYDNNGGIVFLKNVGDKISLWFNLEQNINLINGNEKLSVINDEAGSDQYFETPVTDFGRGALIIRHKDYTNQESEPQIYTNYLEANATLGADTKVQLFEEGDYEVALDYKIFNDKLINTTECYRIFFKFSVRNGNCMVYPFDLKTGEELTNSSITENGFRLDLAKSRYLKINVSRQVLTESADGLVEDVRFNGPAKDGAEYIEDGIYVITANNIYTNQLTVKKIYVGKNKVLMAHMITGLSVPEINNLINCGATIDNSGNIELDADVEVTDYEKELSETFIAATDNNESQITSVIVFILLIGIIIVLVIIKHKKTKNKDDITVSSQSVDENIVEKEINIREEE